MSVDALTNGPVRLSSSLRIGHNWPGIILLGVPGAFLSRAISLSAFGARILCQTIEQLCQDFSDGLHLRRFPFDFTALGQANSETKGFGNVRKVVGEIRNV